MPPREDAPYRLLVEGPDDKHAIIHLMRERGVDWDKPDHWLPYIEECGGKSEVVAKIDAVLFKSLERIGIVVDADEDPGGRWASVRDRLRKHGLDVSDDLPAKGLIAKGEIQGHAYRCGVWVMPDNRADGMLEDFLSTLIDDKDKRWPHACEATDTAKTLGAPFPDALGAKARLHTWLAWQQKPGQPFGQAITARALASQSPVADDFVDWFTRLFRDK